MAFPASEQIIAAAENTLGRSLPDGLRGRLLADNGGQVVDGDHHAWTLHPVLDRTDRKRLTRTANDIARETRSAREWAGFPPEAISIAADDYGNRLVLLPGSDTVSAWDHETGAVEAVTIDWTRRG